MSRVSKYKAEFAEQVFKLCLLGLTDNELAVVFDVSETTVNNWKRKYPKFGENLKRGKCLADSEVAYSLYRRAIGDEKHYPSATACIFWLRNRRSDKWRAKPEDYSKTSDETKELYLEMMKKMSE